MKQSELCPGKAESVAIQLDADQQISHHEAFFNRHAITGVKRIRMKCELCGAKVLSSVRNCHDGCCASHTMPPHKPNSWWKSRGKSKVV